MLDRLVASRPEHAAGGTTASALLALALHGGLVAGAVVATWPAPRAAPRPPILLADVPYAPAPGPRTAAPAGPPLPLAGWRGAEVSIPDVRIPDLRALGTVSSPSDRGMPLGPGAGPGVPWGVGVAGEGTGDALRVPYTVLTVDEAPMLLTRPPLEYPRPLRDAGLEGVVVLEVVIDTAGVPEPASLRVLGSSHRGFEPAAVRVVLGARYRPGRAGGRPVRVLIRQPIAFRLTR